MQYLGFLQVGGNVSVALISAISTAVVGIAGMITTWATARHQASIDLIKLRDERGYQAAITRRQERIQLYSQFLSAISDCVNQVTKTYPKISHQGVEESAFLGSTKIALRYTNALASSLTGR